MRAHFGEFALKQFQLLLLLREIEADFVERVAAVFGFVAQRDDAGFAFGNASFELGNFGFFGGETGLRSRHAGLGTFAVVFKFCEKIFLPGEGGGVVVERFFRGAFVGVDIGNFLCDFGGVNAAALDFGFVRVHFRLNFHGALVCLGERVVFRREAFFELAQFVLAPEDASAFPGVCAAVNEASAIDGFAVERGDE